MDGSRFDALTKHVASTVTRRTTLGGVAAGVLTAVGLAGVDEARAQVEAKRCLKNGKRCGRGADGDPCRRCCSGYSKKRPGAKGRVCACAPQGKGCERTNQCCGNLRCQSGRCAPLGPTCDVCPTGCDFETVQDAIDAATAGEEIRLCARTYTETITIDKQLTLVGTGRNETTLDGNNAGSTVTLTLTPGITVDIRFLTITGGASAVAGGGIATSSGTLNLRNVSVTGNTAATQGGGIDIGTDGVVNLVNTNVTVNVATAGGGVFTNDGATLTIDVDSVVSDNVPDNCAGTGTVNGTCTNP